MNGFTLIELLVVIVMLAILAAIALPSYVESVRKGRRADAVARLTQLQQAQERWRANNPMYGTLADLGVSATPADSYYAFAVAGPASAAAPTASAYTANATVVAGTPQAGDARCQVLTVALAGGNITYSSTNSAGTVDASVRNFCWNR